MDDLDAVSSGPWFLSAHVETRAEPHSYKDQPPVERGDVLFRIVVELGYNHDWGDDQEFTGVEGTIATGWHPDLYHVARSAKRLTELSVEWSVYLGEDTDTYETRFGGLVFDVVVDEAVKRFETALPGVK